MEMLSQATLETARTIPGIRETGGIEKMNGNEEVKALVVLTPKAGCEAIDRIMEFTNYRLAKYRVYLKYIVDIDPMVGLYFKDDHFDRLRKEGQDIVDHQVERLRDFSVDVEVLPFHFGIATEEILRTEKQIQPDIIIVGAPRTSALKRLLAGDFCEDVVRKANAPVLTVRPSVNNRVGYHTQSAAVRYAQ
jgi:nucleotide-binding universal stress UspA family protein